jgi:hypothetical protein
MAGARPRTTAERKADALAKLTAPAADGWVATAGERAHLVPLSIAWVDERIVIALEARSVTARNLTETGAARLALGGTRDVVLVDARLEAIHEVSAAPAELADAYADQSDWDPRADAGGYVFMVLRPDRVQVWTEVHELAGRTIMRAGAWVG